MRFGFMASDYGRRYRILGSQSSTARMTLPRGKVLAEGCAMRLKLARARACRGRGAAFADPTVCLVVSCMAAVSG